MSKLSITLKYFTYSGVCFGKSVALPPQITKTSIFSFHFMISSTLQTTAVSMLTEISAGFLRVNTATSSISSFWQIASSTPRPKFPYPKIPIRVSNFFSLPKANLPATKWYPEGFILIIFNGYLFHFPAVHGELILAIICQSIRNCAVICRF